MVETLAGYQLYVKVEMEKLSSSYMYWWLVRVFLRGVMCGLEALVPLNVAI